MFPIVKSYKCSEIREINEIGILKIKEGKNLVRIAFLTFSAKDKIVIFDAFDKPDLYQKAKKRKITKVEQKFVERIEKYIWDYLKNRHSLPLNI